MNRLVTLTAEKLLDLAFTLIWTPNTPNPFKPFARDVYWWLDADPEDFYAVPETPPNLVFGKPLKTPFATLVRYRFPSSYTSPYYENNIVHGRANLRPEGKARAAMIFLHGHAMNSFLPMELLAHAAVELGFDIYYMALPFHMQRAPLGTWGGQLSLSSSVDGTAMAFMQGVRDVRCLINWIEHIARLPVYLSGISLGAFTAAMTTVVDDRPRAVVSVIGGGSLGQILWDGYRLGQMRHQLEVGGLTFELLERYWKLLSPGNWWPSIDPERVLLIGGEYDPVVTPENVRLLWRAWGTPPIRWYPAGHTTIGLYHKQLNEEIGRFLEDRV